MYFVGQDRWSNVILQTKLTMPVWLEQARDSSLHLLPTTKTTAAANKGSAMQCNAAQWDLGPWIPPVGRAVPDATRAARLPNQRPRRCRGSPRSYIGLLLEARKATARKTRLQEKVSTAADAMQAEKGSRGHGKAKPKPKQQGRRNTGSKGRDSKNDSLGSLPLFDDEWQGRPERRAGRGFQMLFGDGLTGASLPVKQSNSPKRPQTSRRPLAAQSYGLTGGQLALLGRPHPLIGLSASTYLYSLSTNFPSCATFLQAAGSSTCYVHDRTSNRVVTHFPFQYLGGTPAAIER